MRISYLHAVIQVGPVRDLGADRDRIPQLSPIVPSITPDKMQLYRTNKVQSVQCAATLL